MFVIPFVVTVGLTVSLIEAFWMLPAHVVALGNAPLAAALPTDTGTCEKWTHLLRVKYTRLLIHVMRGMPYPKTYLGLAFAFALFLGAAAGWAPDW